MANHASAKTRVRRNNKRALVNKNRMSRIRTFLKKIDVAISDGDSKAAEVAYRAAQPELDRGVAKGLMHKNTVARKKSRLVSRIKKLS